MPDYYDGKLHVRYVIGRADSRTLSAVIKKPMDLATLLKKVRQQSYRTKKAFSEDLDLIWSNCLLYNSHPVRPFLAFREIRT